MANSERGFCRFLRRALRAHSRKRQKPFHTVTVYIQSNRFPCPNDGDHFMVIELAEDYPWKERFGHCARGLGAVPI
jgi:hypothetical protein